MAAYRQLNRAIIAPLLLISLSIGCSRSDHWIPDAAPPQPQTLYQPAASRTGLPEQFVERAPYRLNVGDVVEIIYQVRNEITDEPYRLKIEDRIKLVFPFQKQFNQEVTVAGDGNIRCMMVGGLRAAGYTAADLELQLKELYRPHLKDPEITVVVEAANVKIEELKKAITTAPRGQSRLVPIKPDGTIDLPYVGECYIAGKTVKDAKVLLDRKYAESDLQEVEVTVQTLEFAPKRIFVHGEVYGPGMITANAPITLMQALIQMGGVSGRGDMSKILLVRRKYEPVPEAIFFDMNALMGVTKPGPGGYVPNGSIYRYDPYLADGDIIYVPPTDIARVNDWIDQVFTRGIRAVIPYSGNVGMNFGYQIHNATVPVKNRDVGPPNIVQTLGP